ncbi:glucans biosynthesis glucosyltransferase MdoH [Sulfitobacter donghicola]|uniref:Glucans biosynthesis glucosyltransferase H n=1 Tax=Sulfitobacter donghicola DSW-25 = KCTC 12864 = JCM 14565 TaxID=1300350 RepID=A0A073IJK8_9RHOB|nr:glucans biosynthesis glucosyltransferase MdoH [Sulfitobacter donghicola]KEJ89785.1 glucosyl transferase family 2 [Sulfitobacter donghicola DSW-25 = KCTC 12864 = JCM 14565]
MSDLPAPYDMPPAAPLVAQEQALKQAPQRATPAHMRSKHGWRLATFVPAVIGTAFLMFGLYGWLANGGMSGMEWALLSMIGATFVWVTLSVSTVGVAIAGLLARAQADARPVGDIAGLDVALLVPVYNEVPQNVFGNAAAMLQDLSNRNSPHIYTLFVLSDTRDEDIAAQEWAAYQDLRANAPDRFTVHYRRRAMNTDKKVGNIAEWTRGWGAAYEGMVVLDADSLMSGRAIDRLASELSSDPHAGLIQTFPMLIGAQTVFARLQQFSNIAYGWLLAEGLATWARSEGNYWGHNAIIRTRAFAASAMLPHMRGANGRKELILSHDFVEAGLLRRAGWGVRFLPRVTGSFEETPATLIDYVIRDRRWCRGNLQHLRLLGTKGLHPVSRFHLFHGAVAYLLSPAWFFLLVIWALLGKDSETNVIRYFNEANPLFPDWPPAMSHIDSAVFLVIMYAMLLTPKIAGAGIIAATPRAARLFGGPRAFLGSFLLEVALSIAYAPIMMIQQSKAVWRALSTKQEAWAPQARDARQHSWSTLLRFHWVEMVLGALLLSGFIAGLISVWLAPIMISLLMAVPLSALSGMKVPENAPAPLRLDSPFTLREPAIVRRAQRERERLEITLAARDIPAE